MMADVFAGKPDARQGGPDVKPSRFRPVYRALNDDEIALHNAIKAKAEELEALIGKGPQSRYGSLAITALEESVMWAVKALTS
jgi:hypothetical protein